MPAKHYRLTVFICLLFSVGLFAQQDPIDSLKKELSKAKNDTDKLYLMIDITEYCELEEIIPYSQQAIVFADKILKKPEYASTKVQRAILREKGLAFINIGYAYNTQGETDKSLNYYKRGLQVHELALDTSGIAGALNNIAFVYNNTGRSKEAVETFMRALKLREAIHEDAGVASTLNNIAYTYDCQGNIPGALEYYARSLKLYEKIGDKSGVALVLNNMGLIYHKQNEIDMALVNYGKSLKLMEELEDKRGIALLLNNMANIYQDRKQLDKAMQAYQRSLKIDQELDDQKSIALAYNNIGYLHYLHHDLPKALDLLHQSLEIRRVIKDVKGMAYSYSSLGTTYFEAGKLKLAYAYCDSALVISKSSGFSENIRKAEEMLAKIDSANGNFASSLMHYKQFILYRDSINSEKTRNASYKTQLSYDYEKKEAVLKEQQEKERAIADEKHHQQQLVIWFVALGLGVVVVFSFFIFRSLQQNKKANKIITLQKAEVERQKEVVEHKNEIIEEKQKEILDSINYAKRIQYTLLAHADFLKAHLPEHFIFFHPKDIVSGDFYWATKNQQRFYLAICDSTGHGVPGAFMSLLNIGFLSEAVNEKNILAPHEVLNYVRQRLTDSISKDGQQDGFDGILMCYDLGTKQLTYAAAHNAPVLVRGTELIELPSDKMPVGVGERKESFSLYTVDYQPGDMLFMYTDGYADQFGGPKGKKFKYKPLNQLLIDQAQQPLAQQQEVLESTFNDWKGTLEQVDDVCIVGIRF